MFDLFTSSSTPHTIVRFIVLFQLLTVLVCALSLPLFDHSWRVNGTTLIQSGPRVGMTPGDPHRAGFEHLMLDRHAQSFDWPTVAQTVLVSVASGDCDSNRAFQCHCTVAGHTHCSGQDAYTQTHSFTHDPSTQSAQPSLNLFLQTDTPTAHHIFSCTVVAECKVTH